MKFSRLHPRIKHGSSNTGDLLILVFIIILVITAGVLVLVGFPH